MSAISEITAVHQFQNTGSSGEDFALLNAVTKRYSNGTVAVDRLSLTLRRGEVVALLGPNGAGKSTTIKLLMGLSSPTSGSVRVFGSDPRNASTRLRIGVMMQVGRAPEMLRVSEHIELFRGYYPNPMPYEKLIEAAGLQGLERSLFGQLSGGQKQRLLFALALAGDPALVFLDEPTVGFDIKARRGIWAQIRELAARGKTVLLTTHYLEEADSLAHRVVVINKGRVVCEGTPSEVKSFGAAVSGVDNTHGIKAIRCATTLPLEIIRAVRGVRDVKTVDGLVNINSAQAENTLRELLVMDPELHSLEVQSPALEDAFLAITSN